MIGNLPEQCCGCGACESVCGHKAIHIVSGPSGFLLPQVNTDLCVECGLCEQVCPFISKPDTEKPEQYPIAYAARNKDIREVETSRSGAVFTAIASQIIRNGGCVYGAALSDHLVVKHEKAIDPAGLQKFKGSKYTQSDMRGVIKDVRKELMYGKTVLFSGTPCQTAAVRNAIPEKAGTKLYLTDIICHGTASPGAWADFLAYIHQRERRKILKADFRDKSIYGWDGLHRESFVFEDNRKRTYPITFYQDFLIRKSCSECPYATLSRPSDLTLGDFWGWENVCPSMNADNKGISLVLANTPKGVSLLKEVSDNLHLKEVDIRKCMQPNLQRPTLRDSRADEFTRDYERYGFEYVLKKYWPLALSEKLKWRIKRLIGKIG